MRIFSLPIGAAALLLAACSGPADDMPKASVDDGAAVDATAAAPVPALPATGDETRGGDGSPIELTALTEGDVTGAKLEGELACSFASSATAPPLLLAKGNVASRDSARGVFKVAGSVETAASPGGFDAMLKGATFTARGWTFKVALTGAAPGGGESPPTPATLTADRADGAQRVYTGLWTCGP